ncbi:glutathione S-transferase [Dechloromonas sp. ARDL1]|uniref:glutathione S-transferase n=1 Tax=Dechloromonas sp. ARDL1 TaxID=3322121 RepID=UPI003DA6D785
MKLIGSHTSPYTRKVRIVLAEKKIEYDFVVESPWTPGNKVADYNPLGKIPVLVLDDDTALFDSRVIVEYIDNVTPNNKLFPAPNRERIEVKRWEALADGLCDAAVAALLERKRPANEQSADWIDRQLAKVKRALAFMSEELDDKSFCMGTHISMADLALGTALGYLNFRFPEIAWQASHPNLSKLYDKLMQRPAFADTIPHE